MLELSYKTIMNKVWDHLNPTEMESLKPQVDKIRAAKTY